MVVVDRGDFYEMRTPLVPGFVPFEGEAGQTNQRKIFVDVYAVGVWENGEVPFYCVVFDLLKDAQEEALKHRCKFCSDTEPNEGG